MRRNLRLDWRALAQLGALLLTIAWPGLVFAMPAMETLSTVSLFPSSSMNNSSNNSYIQSDHSRSSLGASVVSERSVNQSTNQSINAEFNQSLSTQLTAIATTASTPPQQSSSPSWESEDSSDPDSQQQLEEPLGFVISAVPSQHLAVLSRTERSIRHQHQHQQQKKHHQHPQEQQQQPHPHHQQESPTGNNFIGSKSKRLSNPRSNLSLNSSSSNTPISNLDRNERSTVPQSHLDWSSRKIRLYIKNHMLQVMRDGTVIGIQDENSEFSKSI